MAKGDIVLTVEGTKSGKIAGESLCSAYPGAIDVREWSWGMSSPNAPGGVTATGRTALSELRITKGVDRASTALASVMRNNELIKKATLIVRKAGGVQAVDYLVITIERGRITQWDMATLAPEQPELVERLSIAFEKIDVAYTGQDAKGGKTAASMFSAVVNNQS